MTTLDLSCDFKTDYYDSEEFYADLNQAEAEILHGNYLSVSLKEELDTLFAQ